MHTNSKINFSELEHISAFGGIDNGGAKPQSVSAVVSVTFKVCLPAISAVTTFLSCNRSCS